MSIWTADDIETTLFEHRKEPGQLETMSNPVIEFADVDLSLGAPEARVHVLKEVSFQIGRGEAIGIVGPSGSGKSTLLMTMTGLERPDTGAIKVAGTDVTLLSEDDMATFRGKHIGIVFQSFHLIPTMTALENVAIPLELTGDSDPFGKAARALASVGLSERSGHYPRQLSGGEQQRVAIARALAPNPDIVIADEPTGNLDAETGEVIVQLIFELKEKYGTTLVLVTHDDGLASRCDRTIRMRSGRVDSITCARREPVLKALQE